MLLGLRSRCTTRLRWACWTAAQTLPNRARRSPTVQAAAGAVPVDRLALDELHREIGLAVVGDAAVVERRDVGVVEAGQDLALVAEAAQDAGRSRGPA